MTGEDAVAAVPGYRLVRFGLNTYDLDRLSRFYERAFGARLGTVWRWHGANFERETGAADGAQCLSMTLGESVIELRQFDHPGRPYPTVLSPRENSFQHVAIVVTDMQHAHEQLLQVGGWSAISSAGPQRLPARSGGVSAFKFRDPDGHPLELLSFAPDKIPAHWQSSLRPAVLGIDHSAISVADPARSMEFYAALGLTMAGRTVNHGIEQQLLDGVVNPVVDVIALGGPQETPHVELLHYRGGRRPTPALLQCNDIAATRLIFDSTPAVATPAAVAPAAAAPPGAVWLERTSRQLRDPDGHHIDILGVDSDLARVSDSCS